MTFSTKENIGHVPLYSEQTIYTRQKSSSKSQIFPEMFYIGPIKSISWEAGGYLYFDTKLVRFS